MAEPVPIVALMDSFRLTAPSWARWRVVAKVLDGLPLTAEEHGIFEHHTQRLRAPSEPPAEMYLI